MSAAKPACERTRRTERPPRPLSIMPRQGRIDGLGEKKGLADMDSIALQSVESYEALNGSTVGSSNLFQRISSPDLD